MTTDAPDAGSSELPPSYDSLTDTSANELLQPTILVLAGQSIHAESANSAPLYQLNRGIASLSHATQEVEFSRVERTVRTGSYGEPAIKPRVRHVYNLRYIGGGAPGSLPSDSPHYFIRAVSRRTVGHVGVKKSRFRSQWKAVPVDVSGRNSELGLPQFVRDAGPLFEIRRRGDRYEWTDGDGKDVAVEDEGEDQHRLLVTASLHQETMDALVALWCCRIWQFSADHKERIHEGMEGGE